MRLLAEIPSALLPPKIDISYHTNVKLEFRKAEKMGDHQHNPKNSQNSSLHSSINE